MDTTQFSGIITGRGESISGREDSQLYWRMSRDWAGRNQQGLHVQKGGRNRKMAGTNCDGSCPNAPAPAHAAQDAVFSD